jgi:hypothetical protein
MKNVFPPDRKVRVHPLKKLNKIEEVFSNRSWAWRSEAVGPTIADGLGQRLGTSARSLSLVCVKSWRERTNGSRETTRDFKSS